MLGIGPALLLTLWQNLIMPNMIFRSAMVRAWRTVHFSRGHQAARRAQPHSMVFLLKGHEHIQKFRALQAVESAGSVPRPTCLTTCVLVLRASGIAAVPQPGRE